MTAQLSDRGGWRGAMDRGMGWLPARLRRSSAVVPVVRLSGVIGAVTPLRPGMTLAGVAKMLEKAFATKNARAVALVINSPGGRVEVQDAEGKPCAPGVAGELKVWRHGNWIATKDLGRTDEDGYFYHGGRADDVIISAGWTMSAVEIEDAILKHPQVREAAAIGVPDPLRGQVVKAFVVTDRPGDTSFEHEIQDVVRQRLSHHEYPRLVSFVTELPKTPAGKVNRKVLRDREHAVKQ